MQILTVLFLLAIAIVLGFGVYVLLSVDITPEPHSGRADSEYRFFWSAPRAPGPCHRLPSVDVAGRRGGTGT